MNTIFMQMFLPIFAQVFAIFNGSVAYFMVAGGYLRQSLNCFSGSLTFSRNLDQLQWNFGILVQKVCIFSQKFVIYGHF